MSFTRAQGIPKYKIGFGREKDGRVGRDWLRGVGLSEGNARTCSVMCRSVPSHLPLSRLSPPCPLAQVPNWDAGTWTGLTLPQAMWGPDQVALKPADYGSTTVQYSQGVFGAQLNL